MISELKKQNLQLFSTLQLQLIGCTDRNTILFITIRIILQKNV